MKKSIDGLNINTLRMLSLGMVEKTKSGHPGLPLGGAAMMYVLSSRVMNHNLRNPEWHNRDRFLLSAGQGPATIRYLSFPLMSKKAGY
ncbi:MAG: hypothetical protein ACLFV2_04805 [Desulfurivibrionaceae bacterium]